MNIFLLDSDPVKIAQYSCNSHVVKMPTESAQILSSVHWFLGREAPCKPYQMNNRFNVWARKSLSNYKHLILIGYALCEEYTYRFGKHHKSQDKIDWCFENMPKIEDIGLTEFALSMPEKYYNADAVKAYRDYYNGEKSHLFKWTKRNKPWWIKEEQ